MTYFDGLHRPMVFHRQQPKDKKNRFYEPQYTPDEDALDEDIPDEEYKE